MSTEAAPFSVSFLAAEIDDLRNRLRTTRWPSDLDHADQDAWEWGIPGDDLRALALYWAEEFDWKSAEAFFNRFAQFTMPIDGLATHFVHARSADENATPLLLMHGWPGSVFEFWDAIPLLTNAEEGSGFHVVAPSLPGYGYSEAPRVRGMTPKAIALRHDRLMKALGYDRYIIQGGDWGALIARRMPDVCQNSLLGMHLNLALPTPPTDVPDPMTLLDEQQRAQVQMAAEKDWSLSGYSHEQGTKPQTLAFGLTDSPAGLAAWIAEKLVGWSHDGRRFLEGPGRDWLLCNISLYWLTRSMGTSIRLYREFFDANFGGDHPGIPCTVPTGIANYPRELWRTPRPWAEREYNLVHWFDAPRGGHFAALEEPDLFVQDLRSFCQRLHS